MAPKKPTKAGTHNPGYLAQWRNRADLTQAKLGKLVGVTGASINQYESGKQSLKADVLLKLAAALDASIDDILLRDPRVVDDVGEIVKLLRAADPVRRKAAIAAVKAILSS